MVKKKKKLIIICVALLILFSCKVCYAFPTIQRVSGNLTFNITLNGNDIYNKTAGATPTVRVDSDTNGWNLTMSCTDFENGSDVISVHDLTNNTGLYFSPSTAGYLDRVNGAIKPGDPVIWTSSPNFMNVPVKCLSATAGKGKFDYRPALSDFTIDVLNDIVPGSYTALMTITVSVGP